MDDNVILNRLQETAEFRQMQERVSKFTYQEWNEIKEQYAKIVTTMLDCKQLGLGPDSAEMQHLVEVWKKHINDFYYTCDKARLRTTYKMFKEDSGYKRQLDQFEEGFADYFADAIDYYLKNN